MRSPPPLRRPGNVHVRHRARVRADYILQAGRGGRETRVSGGLRSAPRSPHRRAAASASSSTLRLAPGSRTDHAQIIIKGGVGGGASVPPNREAARRMSRCYSHRLRYLRETVRSSPFRAGACTNGTGYRGEVPTSFTPVADSCVLHIPCFRFQTAGCLAAPTFTPVRLNI